MADDATRSAEPFAARWLARASAEPHADPEVAKVQALFQTAFTSAPIGMAVVDEDGRIVIANAALGRIVGLAADALNALDVTTLVEPDGLDAVTDDHARLLAGELTAYTARVRLRRPGRPSVWVLMTVARDGGPPPSSFVYQMQDISERRELEGRLEYLIDHDFLTGLYNRRRFEQELRRQLEMRHRFGGRGAVLVMDIDGFKAVNDHFGHAVGDELLRGLAASLRARSRATDVLARLSGDEFALLLPEADRAEASTVAALLIGIVRGHVTTLGDQRAHVTASVGAALFDGLSDIQVMTLADAAMYAAKESGRDRFVVFTSSDDDAANSSQRVNEANQLRRALADRRFELYCQPIWDLAADRVGLYELLIRMRDDAGRLVEPNAFLYAAERFGLIGEIDRWVISQAVSLVAAHERLGRQVTLSVNLSGRSVGDHELISFIDHELDASEIATSSLVFELTETSAVSNLTAAQALSRHLHHRGCRFALDDFGAGFASFYYLKNLPFDLIKIDGDFVRGLSGNPVDQLVIGAIVMIAKGMQKQTVAEFVTDQETRDLLRDAGVDFAQGFHIAQPAPIAEVLPTAP